MLNRRLHLLLIFSVLFLSSCGDDGDSGGGGGVYQPGPGLRFVLADQQGLFEAEVGGVRRDIATYADLSYPLDPALSPDRQRIAFALQPPARALPDGSVDFGADLYIIGIDGKGQRELVKHQRVAEFLRTPAWLSDSELLFTYRGREAETGLADLHIDRLDIASGKTTRYLDQAVDPAVSKDHSKVVYTAIDPGTQNESLVVAGIDLKDRTTVVSAESNLALFTSAVFSPDGSKIAFAAVDFNASQPGSGSQGMPTGSGGVFASHPFAQDVWTVNSDGSDLRRLAEIAENMPSLSWSGDGTAVYALGPVALWKIDASSGQSEQIGQGVPLGQIVWLSGP